MAGLVLCAVLGGCRERPWYLVCNRNDAYGHGFVVFLYEEHLRCQAVAGAVCLVYGATPGDVFALCAVHLATGLFLFVPEVVQKSVFVFHCTWNSCEKWLYYTDSVLSVSYPGSVR